PLPSALCPFPCLCPLPRPYPKALFPRHDSEASNPPITHFFTFASPRRRFTPPTGSAFRGAFHGISASARTRHGKDGMRMTRPLSRLAFLTLLAAAFCSLGSY